MNKKKNFISYAEASKLCSDNNIMSPQEYKSRYKEFPGLPSNPNIVYKDNWVSWTSFFNKKYVSFQEAKELCIKNGIKNYKDYVRRYKEFAGLPSSMNVYKEFTGWTSFLDKEFLNYDEAKKVLAANNINSTNLYRTKYKELSAKLSKRLPSNPNVVYNGSGWVSWKQFLKSDNSGDQPPTN